METLEKKLDELSLFELGMRSLDTFYWTYYLVCEDHILPFVRRGKPQNTRFLA